MLQWGTLQHVGHPAVIPDYPELPPAEAGQQPQQKPKRKRLPGVKDATEGARKKRKTSLDYKQEQEAAAVKEEYKDNEALEQFLPCMPEADNEVSQEDVVPSSMLDMTLFHGANESLFDNMLTV